MSASDNNEKLFLGPQAKFWSFWIHRPHKTAQSGDPNTIKFIYSESASKFCEISILLLSYVVPVKSKVEISQNFADFSEYMNFTFRDMSWREFC